MIIYDYTKSEDMAKDVIKAVDNIEMQVKETAIPTAYYGDYILQNRKRGKKCK